MWVLEDMSGEVSRGMEGWVGIGSEVLLKELGWGTGKGNGSGATNQGSRREKEEEAKAERKKFKEAEAENKKVRSENEDILASRVMLNFEVGV